MNSKDVYTMQDIPHFDVSNDTAYCLSARDYKSPPIVSYKVSVPNNDMPEVNAIGSVEQ